MNQQQTHKPRGRADRLISHFNVHALPDPRVADEWHNRVQDLAEGARLGIPVTLSSDPRHSFSNNPATSFRSGKFSQWPEPMTLKTRSYLLDMA